MTATGFDTMSPGDQAQWVSAILAGVAVLISVATAWYSTRVATRNDNELARAETYMRLHEMLVSKEAARGRRILLERYHSGTPLRIDPGDWDDVNYSLALLDTLGGYVSHGLVDEKAVRKSWRDPLMAIREPAEAFVDLRHSRHGGRSRTWPYLQELFESLD